MIELGEISIALSLIVCVYAVFVSFYGGFRENDVLVKSGINAFFSAFALLTVASAALVYAFMAED